MTHLCPLELLTTETVHFLAGQFQLEGELVYPNREPLGAIVLAGPHPMLGGSMNNNVMRALGAGLAERGFATLRFNYQGVGTSEGPKVDRAAHLAAFWNSSRAPDDPDRVHDLRAAIAFLQSLIGIGQPFALVGYSFGCTLLPGALPSKKDSIPLALIAPTVGRHDYCAYEELDNPKLVVAPEGDFAADRQQLDEWFERVPGPKQLVRPRRDSHFFRGHEEWLVATVGSFIDDLWSPRI